MNYAKPKARTMTHLQSVGHMYGFNVSSEQSFNVIANGVRLNGAGGFSEFLHNKIYFDSAAFASGLSALAGLIDDPSTLRATSWLFHRPAIS